MADALRTRAALQTLLADNVAGDISAQDIRDFLVSTYNWVNGTIGGDISYTEGNVGIGAAPTSPLTVAGSLNSTVLNITSASVNVGDYVGLEFNQQGGNYKYAQIRGYAEASFGGGKLIFYTGLADGSYGTPTERMSIDKVGAVNIVGGLTVGTSVTATAGFFDAGGDSIRIRTSQTPASGGAGNAGEIAWDTGYIYVCTATNTWERAELTGSY